MTSTSESRRWDAHWQSLGGQSIFHLVALATRRFIFQPAVSFYSDRFFPDRGIFVEMGCGTAESSALISRMDRKLIGLDFSAVALGTAKEIGCMDALVQGDIFSLPYRSGSIAGIWNLGVMEHFTEPQIHSCLQEFWRVLEPGGVVVLFWPSERNASRWVLGPIEKLLSLVRRSKTVFFPDEVSRLRSRNQAATYLVSEGFEVSTIDFSWRTAFIHVVVVASKPV